VGKSNRSTSGRRRGLTPATTYDSGRVGLPGNSAAACPSTPRRPTRDRDGKDGPTPWRAGSSGEGVLAPLRPRTAE